jgi:hypothetical protein
MPNKEMSINEGKRKEVYYVAWSPLEEITSAHFQT